MFEKALQKGSIWAAGIFLTACVIFGACARDIYAGAVNNPDSEAGESGGALQSSNANLKSLSVTPGTLSPEFSPEITDYTVNVSEDVDTISVACSVEETTSKVVEAGGFKRLQPGSNSAFVTVQAADGSRQTYHFTINRGGASGAEGSGEADIQPESQTEPDAETDSLTEAGKTEAPISNGGAVTTSAGADAVEGTVPGAGTPASIDPVTNRIPIGGESIYASFQIDLTYPQELLPEGFVSETYNYKGIDVQSAYFAAGNIRLLYLTTGDGTSSDFRIYYEDTDSFLDFLQLKGIDGKFIMPVRYEAQIKIPDNYTGTYLPWENKVIPAYIYTELTGKPVTAPGEEDEKQEDGQDEETVKVEELDEEVEFYLLYAVNNQGEESFYLYDAVEGTYQRYVERDTSYELDQSYFKYKDVAHRRFAIMCVMACLLLIAVFCIMNLIMQNRELKADLEEDEEDEEDFEKESQENVRKKNRKSREDRKIADKEEKSAAKAVERPEEKSAAKGVERPEEKSAAKAVKGPEEKSAAKAVKRPEEKSVTEAAKRAEKRPAAEAAKRQEQKTEGEASKKAERRPEAEAAKRAVRKPESEAAEGIEKKTAAAKPVKGAAKNAVRETVTEAARDMEIDAFSLEEKIINQLQLDDEIPPKSNERVREAEEEPVRKRPVRKPSNFKMINLSREPEASALDDDFEFEFINLDDD